MAKITLAHLHGIDRVFETLNVPDISLLSGYEVIQRNGRFYKKIMPWSEITHLMYVEVKTPLELTSIGVK